MMAGLLDDFTSLIKTPEGQGLLSGAFGYAAGARRGTPWNNLGRGGIAGLVGYSGAQDREQQQAENAFQQKFRTMQMGDMQRKLDQQAEQQKWLESLNPNQSRLNAALGAGGGPTVANAEKLPAAVDPTQQMMWGAARAGVIPAGDYIKTFLPDSEAFTLSPGQVRVKGGKIVAQAPAESKAPSKVQEYEYAAQNGYKGSFADFVSIGPTISANALAAVRDAQIASINSGIQSQQAKDAYTLPSTPQAAPQAAPKPMGGPVTVTVNGQTFSFPSQQAANQFKQKAGVR